MKALKNTLMGLVVFALIIAGMPAMTQQAQASTTVTAYVTLSDSGSFVSDKNGADIVRRAVTLSGQDSYTLVDVLTELHEQYYADGADGFAYSDAYGYGNGVDKLWGEATSSVGYYVNDQMAMSLDDSVADGDDVAVWFYDDAANYEGYTYFDQKTASASLEDGAASVTLKLSQYSYDSSWNLVAGTVTGASVTVNGTDSGIDTDSEGNATVSFSKAGTYVISATMKNSDGSTAITAPYCVVTVTDSSSDGTTLKTQKIKVKKASLKKTYKAKKLRKKARSFKIKASTTGDGTLTFKKVSGSKRIKINKKTGKVTVKKGTKKGTYKINVKIKASATDTYAKTSVTKTIVVKVK
ncbi:MAG: hypothetical protein K5840_02380 [Eubacterium sp.]|nr:hypothetical protein [Eubacterium sp.]